MHARISIDMDNAAFGDDGIDRGSELARILRGLAEEFDGGGVRTGMNYHLRDLNGNTVGCARIEGGSDRG